MADVYVDSTQTGTGNWVGAYLTLAEGYTNVGVGDTVFIASVHIETSTSFTYAIPDGVSTISASNTTSEYEKGAAITATSGSVEFNAAVENYTSSFFGMVFSASANFQFIRPNNKHYLYDCDIDISSGGAGSFGVSRDGLKVIVDGGSVTFNAKSSSFSINGGSNLLVLNTVISPTVLIERLVSSGGNGGTYATFYGCALDGILVAGKPLVSIGSGSDVTEVKFYRCNVAESELLVTPGNLNKSYTIELYACSSASNPEFYRIAKPEGESLLDDTNHVTSESFSALIDIFALADINTPFSTRLSSLSDINLTSSRTITIEVSSDVVLTTSNFWIDLLTPSDDAVVGTTETSRAIDVIGSGVPYDTSSETWTGGGTNKYSINITIPAYVGKTEKRIDIYVHSTLANTNIWASMLGRVS